MRFCTFEYFSEICPENSSFLKISQEMAILPEDQYIVFIISPSVLLRRRNIIEKKL
jgi:hypothetical protein